MGKYKPSRSKRAEYARLMAEIEEFCVKNGIVKSGGSYYFTIDNQDYRVSNHSIEASNRRAFDPMTGEQRRAKYHDGRREDTIYIHASQTRIVEIFNNLKKGVKLDGKGFRK